MLKKLKTIISSVLIFTLVCSRVFSLFASDVYAIDPPPAVPTVGAPQSVQPPQTAVSAATGPPAVPTVPSVNNNNTQTPQQVVTVTPAVSQPVSTAEPTVTPSQDTGGSSNSTPTAMPSDSPASSSDSSGASTNGTNQTSVSATTAGTNVNNPDSTGTGDSSAVNDPANIGTGAFSQNQATEILNQKLDTLNKNLADVNNKVNAISSTGFNFANFNTLSGQVFTGDSTSATNLLNKLNSNITGDGGFSVYNIYGNQSGDITFQLADAAVTNSFSNASSTVSKNTATGPYSTNIADASNTFQVNEASGNDAKLVNDINLLAQTGGNSASYNTGGGYIKTGNALASGNIINLVNSNINVSKWLIGVVNIFGTLAGNIVLPKTTADLGPANKSTSVNAANTDTGAGSTNDSSYTSSTDSLLANNNEAAVTSNLTVSANTGNNDASANTYGGFISTGEANTVVSNSTIANSNVSNKDDTVWMVIVNEAGKWVGKIIGNPYGTTSASNSLPISTTTGSSGSQNYTTTYNSNTGPLSTNEASYSSTLSETSNTTNNASIQNNITADADSGNNNTTLNTGQGVIDTGDAKVGLNLTNIVNTNVVAKKFVAIFVNVLGNFLGDVITPNANSQAVSNNTNTNTNNTNITASPTPTTAKTNNNSSVEDDRTGSTDSGEYQTPVFSDNSGSYADSTVSDTADSSSGSTAADYQPVNFPYVNPTIKNQTYKRYYPTQVKIIKSQNNTASGSKGTFMSPAFTGATETSFAGILLGGARIKIDQTWLWILPVTLFIYFLRRRKKYHLIRYIKYLDLILDIIL